MVLSGKCLGQPGQSQGLSGAMSLGCGYCCLSETGAIRQGESRARFSGPDRCLTPLPLVSALPQRMLSLGAAPPPRPAEEQVKGLSPSIRDNPEGPHQLQSTRGTVEAELLGSPLALGQPGFPPSLAGVDATGPPRPWVCPATPDRPRTVIHLCAGLLAKLVTSQGGYQARSLLLGSLTIAGPQS